MTHEEFSVLDSGLAASIMNATGMLEHTEDAFLRRNSIGAANSLIDPRYEGKPYMIILWLFISFVIGAFTRHLLEVKTAKPFFFPMERHWAAIS
jgi:hypothetical protein